MELPHLISDLALMLLLAGIITIIFKKLNQPLVLGYIVAGFLVSSYCTIMPTVSDLTSIETWSEIGIIVMMFALGLEFNLHKLAKVGGTAIITALIEVIFLALIGFGIGQAMGWTTMEALFLGGMLSMSSTTIIIKAFDDLHMRKHKFTDNVLGVLIIEDIAGILMMIMLTTISVSQNVDGWSLAVHMFSMLMYLALWLVLGIYLIPTAMKKAKRLINDETLLIISLGSCFGMVLLAEFLGFSSALGAFMAGSIFAGTSQGERTERVIKPIKDLFGAIFFISVGMMVQPAMIAKYWLPILIITAVVMFCKPIIGVIGQLLSGQSLNTSVRAGFSLAQVGEFSFIIASIGYGLGVIGEFIYPVIVSVSVVTTFTTPFFIKHSDRIYHVINKHLPQKLKDNLSKYTSEKRSEKEQGREWSNFLKMYAKKTLLYTIICVAVLVAGTQLLLPWLIPVLPQPIYARIITIIVILLICAPLLSAMVRSRNKNFISLWTKSTSNRLPLVVFIGLRIFISIAVVFAAFILTFDVFNIWIVLIMIALLVLILTSRHLIGFYLRVEARFLSNLNELQLAERAEAGQAKHHWLDETLSVAKVTIPDDADIIGKTLAELRWGAVYSINVIKMIRNKKHINIPEGYEQLLPGDILYATGDKKYLETWLLALGLTDENEGEMPDLRSFINSQAEKFSAHDHLLSYALEVEKGMGLAYKSIRDAGIKTRFRCIMIGLERNMLPIFQPKPDMVLQNGDILWLLGSDKMGSELLKEDLLAAKEDNSDNSGDPELSEIELESEK